MTLIFHANHSSLTRADMGAASSRVNSCSSSAKGFVPLRSSENLIPEGYLGSEMPSVLLGSERILQNPAICHCESRRGVAIPSKEGSLPDELVEDPCRGQTPSAFIGVKFCTQGGFEFDSLRSQPPLNPTRDQKIDKHNIFIGFGGSRSNCLESQA
jgi:hypothetical protein